MRPQIRLETAAVAANPGTSRQAETSPQKPAKPPRRSQQERSDTTRAKLLEATVASLYENGYAATTTKVVVERAGLTRGAVLHHFPTKVDLIIETARYIIDAQKVFRHTLRSKSPTPRQHLDETVDVILASHARPHALALLEIMMGARGDPELATRYPEIQREIEQDQRDNFWRRAQAAGIKDRKTTDALVVLTLATMRGFSIERVYDPGSEAFAGAVELFRQARARILEDLISKG